MFEDCGEAELLEVMGQAQRAERAATARRLMAVGEFSKRRIDRVANEHRWWCVDDWEAIAAEVAAELGISRGRASSQMRYGQALVERFPQLGAIFAAGEVDFHVIAAAIFRTDLVTDKDVLAQIDATLANKAPHWNKLSREKITQLVDWLVIDLDPEAVRVARQRDADRHIEVEPSQNGMADIWGEVRAPDAAAFDTRLNALADSVCRDDPRTKGQRRADALAALAAGHGSMACECGSEDCPAANNGSSTVGIVINVLAEASTVESKSAKPGYLAGYGALPAEAVQRLATRAIIRPIPIPTDLLAEQHYRPSAALGRFVRCRDITCRFPGCDRPAEVCDIDHSVPYPFGPTHPSNNKLYCRIHHLLKTFYAGAGGWSEQQLADGTIVWTSPSGRTYTSKPFGAFLFPQLALPTSELALPNGPPPGQNRGLAMPTRRRTRAEDRSYRVQWERNINRARYAADPPPF